MRQVERFYGTEEPFLGHPIDRYLKVSFQGNLNFFLIIIIIYYSDSLNLNLSITKGFWSKSLFYKPLILILITRFVTNVNDLISFAFRKWIFFRLLLLFLLLGHRVEMVSGRERGGAVAQVWFARTRRRNICDVRKETKEIQQAEAVFTFQRVV